MDTTIDAGTTERSRHQGGLRFGARIQTEGGIVTHHGATAAVECLLDALHAEGGLNGKEGCRADRLAIGRSRYERALDLRRLFVEAGMNGYRTTSFDSRGGSGEISDKMARARMKYNAAIKRMGKYASAVTGAVCMDQRPKHEGVRHALKLGLDILCYESG